MASQAISQAKDSRGLDNSDELVDRDEVKRQPLRQTGKPSSLGKKLADIHY